jgi:integrase
MSDPRSNRDRISVITDHTRARTYERAALAAGTLRTYLASWQDFEEWCREHSRTTLPASSESVADYLADCADRGLAVSTIRRRLVAISRVHVVGGFTDPCASSYLRNVMAGIARTHGCPAKKKDPLTLEPLRAVIDVLETTLQGRRDRALILFGFAGAFRRSELVALDVADVRWEKRGLVVMIRRSKTDQSGHGREIGIPTLEVPELCPVRNLRAWLERAKITNGPLFRTFGLKRGAEDSALTERRIDGRDVARILQRAIARAGLEGNFAAHSLRAGFITAAAEKNVSEIDIARVSGHVSAEVLRGYVRRAKVLDAPALSAIFTTQKEPA